jgi:membrane-bound metal-dependent hydrolase YbcI (DUF457 family)
MDFLAHIIWSILIFGKLVPFTELMQVGFFSVLPDMIWGIPAFSYFIYRYLRGDKIIRDKRGIPRSSKNFEKIYNFSHSFSVMALMFGILSLIFSRLYFPLLLGWGLHLLIDILIHKDSVFRQRPLYPLSNRTVRGYVWHGEAKFVILNWALIIIIALLYALRII